MAERWGKKFVDKRDWKAYNEELVVRGEFYLDLKWVKDWNNELAQMNKDKRGSPFEFPESLINLQGVWNQWIDFRGIEGVTRQLVEFGQLPDYNDYTCIFRRVTKIKTEFELPMGKDIEVACDGTGMTLVSGGAYRERTYGKKRKKYIKVVITADPIRRKLLHCEVSIEGEGDSEPDIAEKHIDELKKKGKKVKKFWGDGAFDDRDLINKLSEHGTEIAIKPRTPKTSDDPKSANRKKLVDEHNGLGYKEWAKKKEYGMRWVGTEGIFSAVKRKFGESLRSKKIENMFGEARRKFWAYDLIQQYGKA